MRIVQQGQHTLPREIFIIPFVCVCSTIFYLETEKECTLDGDIGIDWIVAKCPNCDRIIKHEVPLSKRERMLYEFVYNVTAS